jgi:hypothetical protein
LKIAIDMILLQWGRFNCLQSLISLLKYKCSDMHEVTIASNAQSVTNLVFDTEGDRRHPKIDAGEILDCVPRKGTHEQESISLGINHQQAAGNRGSPEAIQLALMPPTLT